MSLMNPFLLALLQQRLMHNKPGFGPLHPHDEENIGDHPDEILAGDRRGGPSGRDPQLGDGFAPRPGSGEFGPEDLSELLGAIHGGGDEGEQGLLGGIIDGMYPGGTSNMSPRGMPGMNRMGMSPRQALLQLRMNGRPRA